ncbi:hypothetical protein FACS189426_10690 [Bacteroidia bacterium]|nr:hypothetical protein FACS189426_10690 [Bacteroidia bacterium]
MKTFDLCAYGVAEMTRQEMLETDGGNIFGDAWNWIKGAAETVAAYAVYYYYKALEWISEHQEEIEDAVN